ncbi:hypothetical protein ACUOFC_61915, partial [Escherichia sp. TWPC-MK]
DYTKDFRQVLRKAFPVQALLKLAAALNDSAIDAVGCAWTHPSVDKYNMLASNSITQIPAVMAQK